jgi:hypothetical protein
VGGRSALAAGVMARNFAGSYPADQRLPDGWPSHTLDKAYRCLSDPQRVGPADEWPAPKRHRSGHVRY